MKRKFEVEVVRTDKFVIEVDDSVITEEWMAQFRNVFYDFRTIEEHVEHVAQLRARFCSQNLYGGLMEGYGDVANKGRIDPRSTWPFPAINFVELDEDNDIVVEVEEV